MTLQKAGEKQLTIWGDLDKIEMTQEGQTVMAREVEFAERICHMLQMLEICSWLAGGGGCRFSLSLIGKPSAAGRR